MRLHCWLQADMPASLPNRHCLQAAATVLFRLCWWFRVLWDRSCTLHPCACMRHTPVISERLMQPARTSTATVTLSKATSSGGTTPPLTGICSAAFESPRSSPAQSRLPAQLLSVPQSSMPSSCAVSPARALPPALAAGFATDLPAGDVASSRRGLMVLVLLSFGKHRCSCLTLQCRSPSSLRHS